MNTTNQKKRRLQTILVVAAAIGSSSASLSGAVGSLNIQHQPPAAAVTLA